MCKYFFLLLVLVWANTATAGLVLSVNGDINLDEITLEPSDNISLGIHLTEGSSCEVYDVQLTMNNPVTGILDATEITFPTVYEFAGKVLGNAAPDTLRIGGSQFFNASPIGPTMIADQIQFDCNGSGETVLLSLITAADGTIIDNDPLAEGTVLDTLTIRKTGGQINSTDLTIVKALVKAKKNREAPLDKIVLTGTLTEPPESFEGIDELAVQISCQEKIFSDETITFDNTRVKLNNKNTKLNYVGPKESPYIIRINLDKKTFVVAAMGIDLTGMKDTITLGLSLGDFAAAGTAQENVINGKKLLPICLLYGDSDTLRVKNRKVNKKATSLAVSGEFTMADPELDLSTVPITITWGQQEFVIPATDLTRHKSGKKIFAGKKIALQSGEIAKVNFNLEKCTYKISIKNAAELSRTGTVPFAIKFGNDGFQQNAEITFPE